MNKFNQCNKKKQVFELCLLNEHKEILQGFHFSLLEMKKTASLIFPHKVVNYKINDENILANSDLYFSTFHGQKQYV